MCARAFITTTRYDCVWADAISAENL